MGMAVLVHICDMLGQLAVQLLIRLVLSITLEYWSYEDQEDEVKTREQSSGEVDVLAGRFLHVVAAEERVGGTEERHARIERGLDTRLGDGDGLLLHHLLKTRSKKYFVDGGAVRVIHLIELINAANAVIGQDQSAALDLQLVGLRVAQHTGCQTHAGGTLSLCMKSE